MSYTNQLSEITESLLDLANDFKAEGRTGAWRVLVDATRIIKLHQFHQRTTRALGQRKRQTNTVLAGPRFAIIESSNESGRRAMSSSNASPDHHFLEGESNG